MNANLKLHTNRLTWFCLLNAQISLVRSETYQTKPVGGGGGRGMATLCRGGGGTFIALQPSITSLGIHEREIYTVD